MKAVGYMNVWFEERNFGFANVTQPDGSLLKYFIHRANIMFGTPARNTFVRFDAVTNTKGPLGINAEVFPNRDEMARHDAAVALAQAAQKAGDGAVS